MLQILLKRRYTPRSPHTGHCDNLRSHERFHFLSGSLKCIETRQIFGARSSGCKGNRSYVLHVPTVGCLSHCQSLPIIVFPVAVTASHLCLWDRASSL